MHRGLVEEPEEALGVDDRDRVVERTRWCALPEELGRDENPDVGRRASGLTAIAFCDLAQWRSVGR